MTSGQGWRKHQDDEKIDFLTFSILPYEESLSLQRRLNREMIENGQGEYIILCEHEPVYTCGIHHEGYPENIDPLYIIERGGGVTFHGPGQITCYFLIDLGKRNMNIVDLIHFAHQSEIMYLKNYSVNAISQLGKKTGVWVNNKKISSTGFSLKGGFTMHGIGLNIETDMDRFSQIEPCGFDSSIMTSLSLITRQKFNMDLEKKVFSDIIKKEMGII